MKYLRLELTSDRGAPLYRRAVEVRDVFDVFVRRMASALLREGTLQGGDGYAVVVIPRYGDRMATRSTKTVGEPAPSENGSWLEMRFEEPAIPDRPVAYFTLELSVPDRQLIYRRDFRTADVGHDYVQHRIVQALVQFGVLKSGDRYLPEFFACDDEQPDFERESIPALKRQADSLVELVSETKLVFDARDPAVYGVTEEVGRVLDDGVRIYVRRTALALLRTEARRSKEAERGGMLVGQVFDAPHGGGRLVEVSDLTVSEDARSSLVQFTFNFDSWLKHSQEMRAKFPGRRVVGWYHTHLINTPIADASGNEATESTRLFFSRDDVFTQKQFFHDEWYLALVLDPDDGQMFFRMKDGEVVGCPGYYLFDETNTGPARGGTA